MNTDRTRITTYQVCPRLRFLSFHYNGTGIVPAGVAHELRFGIAYHRAIEQLLTATITPSDPDPDARIIKEASDALLIGLDLTGRPPFFAIEQRFLIEGLLWAWISVRRDRLLSQYEIVKTEQEFIWDMGSGITLMVRLDALIRDRFTSDLYYLEHKTTSSGNEKWADTFTHSAQVMAGILACEQALSEKPVGVIIEGHVKGSRRIDTAQNSEISGFEFQDSPLCYIWELPDKSVTSKWQSRGRRVPVSSLVESPRDWVNEVLTSLERENCFRSIPPILPDRIHLQRWLRQTVIQEAAIEAALRALVEADSIEFRRILDTTFPLHDTSCEWQYGRRCSHWVFCHDAVSASNPELVGGFVPRTPHHPAEIIPLTPSADSTTVPETI